MCCGKNKKKGVKPNDLAIIKKKSASSGKYSSSKKSSSNGKRV